MKRRGETPDASIGLLANISLIEHQPRLGSVHDQTKRSTATRASRVGEAKERNVVEAFFHKTKS